MNTNGAQENIMTSPAFDPTAKSITHTAQRLQRLCLDSDTTSCHEKQIAENMHLVGPGPLLEFLASRHNNTKLYPAGSDKPKANKISSFAKSDSPITAGQTTRKARAAMLRTV
jgi:hypothetical protein